MGHHAIAFHLSKPEATVPSTPFGWLTRQDLSRTSPSRVDLITHHVLKALIVSWIQEDHNLHPLPCEAIIHDLVAVSLVAQIVQLVGNVLYSLPLERRCVTLISVQAGNLAKNGLDHVTNGHARRDGVRVDYHVWHDALNCERQVLLPVRHATGSFLSMPTGELVSDLGYLDGSHLDLDQAAHLLVRSQHDLINVALL